MIRHGENVARHIEYRPAPEYPPRRAAKAIHRSHELEAGPNRLLAVDRRGEIAGSHRPSVLDGKEAWDGHGDGPADLDFNGALRPGSTHLLAIEVRGTHSLMGVASRLARLHAGAPPDVQPGRRLEPVDRRTSLRGADQAAGTIEGDDGPPIHRDS